MSLTARRLERSAKPHAARAWSRRHFAVSLLRRAAGSAGSPDGLLLGQRAAYLPAASSAAASRRSAPTSSLVSISSIRSSISAARALPSTAAPAARKRSLTSSGVAATTSARRSTIALPSVEPELDLGALRARKCGAQAGIGLEPDEVDQSPISPGRPGARSSTPRRRRSRALPPRRTGCSSWPGAPARRAR